MYNNISFNDEEGYSDLNDSHESIEPDDLIIIKDHNWVPPEEIILAYAKNLGFDIINDPPELINIARKYLLTPLPDNLFRCFRKDNFQIYYLDAETSVLTLENNIDLECKTEYEIMKNKLKEEKQSKKKKKGKKEGKNSSKSKSKKKSKKKKSSKNSSERISNDEDEKIKNDKIDDNDLIDENTKINLLKKYKDKYRKYKEKCKKNFIKNKKDINTSYIETYEKKMILEKRKLKDKLEKEIVKNREKELKREYNDNLEDYRNQLEEDYKNALLNNSSNQRHTNELNNLQSKIDQIKKEIENQEEKNKQILEQQKKKILDEIEQIKNKKNEEYKIKYASLDENNNKKIAKKEKEFEKEYQKYINQLMLRNDSYNNNNDEINRIKKNSDILFNNYKNEMNEEFEIKKIEIKQELEEKNQKEIEEYKINIKQQNDNEAKEINNKIINIEQNYYDELDIIKNQCNANKKKNEEEKSDFINNDIKSLYNLDKMCKGMDELIHNITNDVNVENIEENINIKSNELFLKLNEIKSLFDISEKDYIKSVFSFEYYKNLMSLIINKIIEKKNILEDDNMKDNKINDTILVNELITNCKDLINTYSNKFKNEKNKKLFLNLERKFKEINDKNKIRNYNNRIEKSFYEQSSKNAINTTIGDIKNFLFQNNKNNLNKTLTNNNIINTSNFNKTQINNNNFSNLNSTINENLSNVRDMYSNNKSLSAHKNYSNVSYLKNSRQFDQSNNLVNYIHPNDLNSSNYQSNNFNNNNNNINRSKTSRNIYNMKQNDIINSNNSRYNNSKININNTNNLLTYSGRYQVNNTKSNSNLYQLNKSKTSNNNNNNNFSMDNFAKNINNNEENKKNNKQENVDENINYNNIDDLPKLNDDIKNKLSEENYSLYIHIIDFLSEEYESLNVKINKLRNRNNINNGLNSIKQSIYFKNYHNILQSIYNSENEKTETILEDIKLHKKSLDNIKNNCTIVFNKININSFLDEDIKMELNSLLEFINNYKKNNRENGKDQPRNDMEVSNDIHKSKNEQRDNIINNNLVEEEKEKYKDKETGNYSSFPIFYSTYSPYKLSNKINNSFVHSFFNFKKNNEDLKYKLITSKYI